MKEDSFVIVLLVFILFGCVKSDKEILLEGHWVGYNKLKVNGDSLNVIGDRYTTNSELTLFGTNGKDENGYKFNYELNDDVLLLGNRLYHLTFIDSTNISLLEFDPTFPEDPFAKIIFYRRIN